jgi:hypothetical protein
MIGAAGQPFLDERVKLTLEFTDLVRYDNAVLLRVDRPGT